MSEHEREEVQHELKKAVDQAKSFQKDLSQMRPIPSCKVTVSVTGTIGGDSGTSACKATFEGDHKGDATKLGAEFKSNHPTATCTAEVGKVVVCTGA